LAVLVELMVSVAAAAVWSVTLVPVTVDAELADVNTTSWLVEL